MARCEPAPWLANTLKFIYRNFLQKKNAHAFFTLSNPSIFIFLLKTR
ncbi:hypothetical protein MuYL_1553 [Mucilaginibacter xinganensis]|uniref:Uncharacterized protein n=1 Tax=Mucilaginibacter xinganensis TaxID=1234841 RepID=A0A223NV98_9SPHI|nr:hypothetical protein MuYL_1553 [Mucilaginibacter xinganensis]